MKSIKIIKENKIKKRCDQDPVYANSKLTTEDNIGEVLYISFGLKIIELIACIFSLSYFVGMFWLIMYEFEEDFVLAADYHASE